MKRRGVALVALAFPIACGARTSEPEGGRRSAGAIGNTVDVSGLANACGGTRSLSDPPGAPCGACGVLVCDGADATRCDERARLNACGNCGPLPQEECNGRDDDCNGTVDEGCVLRIGTLPTAFTRVRVSGNYAVIDSGFGGPQGNDVALVRISDGDTRILTPHATPLGGPDDPSREFGGDIDGDLVAYASTEKPHVITGSAFALHAFDLGSGVDSSLPAYGSDPAVDAGRIAFVSYDQGRDISIWTAATNGVERVTSTSEQEHEPALSGDWLVFERRPADDSPFQADVVARSLSTGEEIVLSDGLDGWHTRAAIDFPIVVWQAETGSQAPSYSADVYVYDLSTRQRRALTTGKTGYAPRVSDSIVCLSTGPFDTNRATAVFDLGTDRTLSLSKGGRDCDIDRRRVAWISGRMAYRRDLLDGEP